jgi:hypothetical protein
VAAHSPAPAPFADGLDSDEDDLSTALAASILEAHQRREKKKLAKVLFAHHTAYVKRLKDDFRVVKIDADGDCLFTCFAKFLNTNNVSIDSSTPFSAKTLRTISANELIRLNGQIPGMM